MYFECPSSDGHSTDACRILGAHLTSLGGHSADTQCSFNGHSMLTQLRLDEHSSLDGIGGALDKGSMQFVELSIRTAIN